MQCMLPLQDRLHNNSTRVTERLVWCVLLSLASALYSTLGSVRAPLRLEEVLLLPDGVVLENGHLKKPS